MKASVIIVALNEWADLEATIALARASDPPLHEIIIVDDGSDIPIARRVGSFPNIKGLPPVRVIRHDQPRGVDNAGRLTGADAATGDVLIFLDAHMRLPLDWLAYVQAAVEAFPQSIFTTVCKGFELHGAFCAAGAKFNYTNHGGWIGIQWLDPGVEKIETCPAVMGANYIVPRPVWDAMGGVNRAMRGWGYFEQDLSLRAWLTGHEVRRINNLVLLHNFNRKRVGETRPTGVHMHTNLLHIAHSLFEDATFAQRLMPYLDRAAVDLFRAQDRQAQAERARFQPLRVLSDAQLFEACGYAVPDDATIKLLRDRKAGEVTTVSGWNWPTGRERS